VFAPDLRIAQQELIRTYERREEQPELFQAAVKKMEYWQVDSSVIMEIASSGEEQVYLPVYAAHSGYIKSIQVKEGAFLNRGSVLFEISDLSSVWVSLDVHESQLNRVKNGQSFSFQTLASDQVYQARVDYIDPFVDRQKRTATVRATVVNSGRKFKPGMLVNAFLPFQSGDSKASQLMLPATAVLWTGERSVVYVQDEESDVPSFRYTEVVLGSKEGNQYPVLSGLSEGDRVVVQGAFTLDAAAQLNNKKSMINQWVEGGGNPILQRVKLNPVAKEKSAQLLDHYVQLKEYLVQADSVAAAQSGKELTRKVQSFQESLKNTNAKDWIAANMKEFRSAAQRIEVSKDIESQRLAFETLSNILIEWVTHIEMGAQVMYVQHCPMAFDDQGADWISYEEGIKNPYFGDRMLKCGITESIIRNQ
jgi:Cu(I)/Ag(I) efflux system membrane fusion protein